MFYDKLAFIGDLEKKVKEVARTSEERHDFFTIIDEIIHHRVLHCVLTILDEKHHKEFLVKLYEAPHDERIFDYLKEKIKIDVREFVSEEIKSVSFEILKSLEIEEGNFLKKKNNSRKRRKK